MSRTELKSERYVKTFSPTSGVNVGDSPLNLTDQELAMSINGYYPRKSRLWTVRPPLSACVDLAHSLSDPILKGFSYYNGTTQYLVCASGGKLYSMTKAVLDATAPYWTEVGSLTDSTTKPAMISFNSLLLIADGGSAIRYWDGTTYGTLTNSPAGATALLEARNSVWANSSSAADTVYISTAEFTGTDFDQVAGSVTIKAGFGDGLAVNALAIAPGGNAVVVSKANSEQGEAQMRLVDVSDSTRANWSVSSPFINKEAAQNAHGMLSSSNSVFFFDETGIKKIEPTDQYGDLQGSDLFGDRINKVFEEFSAEVNEITYIPSFTAFVLLIKSQQQQYLYFPRNNAWSMWSFGNAIINSIVSLDGTIYMFSEDGYLYCLDEDKTTGTDETTPGDTEVSISAYGRTRRVINLGYGVKLNRSTMTLTPKKSGEVSFNAILDNGDTVPIGSFDIDGGADLLGIDDGLLGEYDELLGASDTTLQTEKLYGGPRSSSLQFEWSSLGASYELDYITTELEGPLGG